MCKGEYQLLNSHYAQLMRTEACKEEWMILRIMKYDITMLLYGDFIVLGHGQKKKKSFIKTKNIQTK
jgi:hypothetical protein